MIVVRGGGLAGSAAAITARQHGQEVLVVERSKFPKHKVCGEFLSPEVLPLIDQLGVALPEAAKIRRVFLRFARAEKSFPLDEPALGISRYLLDDRLLSRAQALGATASREGPPPTIIASGRHSRSIRGQRLFGFKTHITGPTTDAVELYFFQRGYIGLNRIEEDRTNVCGLLPEDVLTRSRFDIDDVLAGFEPLRDRLSRSEKMFPWLKTGPLVFGTGRAQDRYLCGDALRFVDPFTGSGMLAALATGMRAGLAAARGDAVALYLSDCMEILERPSVLASLFRAVLSTPVGEYLATVVPGRALYRLTRPRVR